VLVRSLRTGFRPAPLVVSSRVYPAPRFWKAVFWKAAE